MSKNYEFFMRTNFQNYAGEWVVICNEKLVAHGQDIKKAFLKAKKLYPEEMPFIALVKDREWLL